MPLARSLHGISGLLAAICVVGFVAEAQAQRRARVKIESDPPGATIYYDVGDEARVEQTPHTDRLRPGTYTVIFELDGYRDRIMDIRVRRKRRVQRFKAELEQINPAYLRIETSGDAGVEIRIDGDERGAAPADLEVKPGARYVELLVGDEVEHEEWVEVEAGQTVTVAPPGLGGGGGGDPPANEDSFVDQETPNELDDTVEKKSSPEQAEEGTLFAVGGGLELGGRRFRFQGARRLNDNQKNLRPYDAGGLPLLRLMAEIYPLGQSGSRYLRGLGVIGSYAQALPFDSTTSGEGMPVAVSTNFSDFEAGARYRYPLSADFYVGGKFTYGGQTFTFDDGDMSKQTGIDSEVPGVDYRFLRLGLDAGGTSGDYTFFGGAHTQQVIQVGTLADRFDGTEILSFGGRAGVSARLFPPMDLSLVATYNYYSLDFTLNDLEQAEYVADGGTDQFFAVMFAATYVY